ncbi:MAG: hypothetical protein NTW65_12260 [Deltaproteobacteria bacterium]|nr:hypothetical protein [Deltaproteobacteria bacterium]
MFMLTHTYFLQRVLGTADVKNIDPDVYVYNIIPDLLPINPQISSNRTHKIKRSPQIPDKYPRSAYVMFHLLVDDLSHYGYICSDYQDEFDSNSKGYCYVKGKPLIDTILNLHKIIRKEISYEEAAYQSHLIVEMIYDLVILEQINSFKTIDILVEAINFTVKNKMKEFVSTINWLYDVEKDEINEVMKNASIYITKERMESIMNMESRIHLYKGKFGLKSNEQLFYNDLKNLFQKALDLIDDDELFFRETVQTIKNYSGLPASI